MVTTQVEEDESPRRAWYEHRTIEFIFSIFLPLYRLLLQRLYLLEEVLHVKLQERQRYIVQTSFKTQSRWKRHHPRKAKSMMPNSSRSSSTKREISEDVIDTVGETVLIVNMTSQDELVQIQLMMDEMKSSREDRQRRDREKEEREKWEMKKRNTGEGERRADQARPTL